MWAVIRGVKGHGFKPSENFSPPTTQLDQSKLSSQPGWEEETILTRLQGRSLKRLRGSYQ